MKMYHFADAGKTNPTCSELACGEQGRTVEPISKAKKKAAAMITTAENGAIGQQLRL